MSKYSPLSIDLLMFSSNSSSKSNLRVFLFLRCKFDYVCLYSLYCLYYYYELRINCPAEFQVLSFSLHFKFVLTSF